MLPKIHSNDSWTQLEEVWLGDVYPHEFYAHLAPEVRDVFYRITDITREDLDIIQQQLQEAGVRVRRPAYSRLEDQLDHRDQLIKPEITPRDHYLVVGNRLILPPHAQYHRKQGVWPWEQAVTEYEQDPGSKVQYHHMPIHVCGANTVRAGMDFFVDCVFSKHIQGEDLGEIFQNQVVPFFPDRRCHFLNNGGHVDGCFAILRQGLIVANRYYQDYDQTFPGWEILLRTQPEFASHSFRPWNADAMKWWLPDSVVTNQNRAFNEHVIQYAQDWVGNYTETYFEVNCLVINPQHVMMLGHNPGLYEYLQTQGIQVQSAPFRCRTFWDGGLHCLTLDIRRQGGIVDYFAKAVDL